MKINKYIELEDKFQDKSFEGNYGRLDSVLNYSSFVGNAASIFFAFFFLNQLLVRTTSDFAGSAFVLGFASIGFLTGFELIKRFVLKNLSFSYLRQKKIDAHVIYNFVFSAILLTGSFYLSLSGAKVFADKSDQVQQVAIVEVAKQTDSLKIIFSEDLEYKIKERDELIEARKKLDEKVINTRYSSQLDQIKQMLKEKNNQIILVDAEIARLRDAEKEELAIIKSDVESSSDKQVEQIAQTQIAFILISSFIELLILAGIFFHAVFISKVYNEFKNNGDNLDRYKLYKDYMKLLSMFYGESGNFGKFHDKDPEKASFMFGIKQVISPDARVTNYHAIKAFNAFIVNQGDFDDGYVKNFIATCIGLEILSPDDKKQLLISLPYSEAKQIISDYF